MADLGVNAAHGAEQWAATLIEALSVESALLRGGARRIPVAGAKAHIPRILTDPAASWTAELAEIDSDAGSGDTLDLEPKALKNIVSISNEAIGDSPISELEAVGRALVRGVANSVDATAFAAAAADATTPAGLLNGLTPDLTPTAVDIPSIVTGVGQVEAAGGRPATCWLNPADLIVLRLAALTGSYATLADPTAPGIERIAGARLVATPAIAEGSALVADPGYVVVGIRRDASVEFSPHAGFSSDSVSARVVMRLDWAIADPAAVAFIEATGP